MTTLEFSHNSGLVVVSFLIALVAGFTGLTLTKDLSQKSFSQRKIAVSLASVALGGGIWSMHFVAMLGLQMPILFYYDAAITLASALFAILIVGVALGLLHFFERRPKILFLSGSLVGFGILTMHYLGMAGLQLCRPIYTVQGISLAFLSAISLCVAAIWIAYEQRSNRNILLGTVCFGLAVFAVHFVAIWGTRFVEAPAFNELGPSITNEVLALIVICSSFLILGAFLWTGVTFLVPQPTQVPNPSAASAAPVSSGAPDPTPAPSSKPAAGPAPSAASRAQRIPCESNGTTLFIAPADVAFIRAEGHYTHVYKNNGERHFCVWPITEATKRLAQYSFLTTHRSYLINSAKVQHFERLKDTGLCRFENPKLPPVPVSRSNLKRVKETLGL
ncbi:MAG: MHYT domain-containing protein [Paracoccaceae bacterium]